MTHREMEVWEPAEAVRFLEHARPRRLFALFDLGLATGMRSGELLGLRWQDLDLERGWLHVRQNAVETGGRTVLGTPKTAASRRRIKLSPAAVTNLRAHRAKQELELQGAAEGYRDHDLVFASEVGTPTSHRNLTRTFAALMSHAGVKRIRVHDLRHSAATAMTRRGYPAKIVADILGHTDPAFTLRVYAKVWEEQREEFAPDTGHLYAPAPVTHVAVN